jgi:hypothetical protein
MIDMRPTSIFEDQEIHSFRDPGPSRLAQPKTLAKHRVARASLPPEKRDKVLRRERDSRGRRSASTARLKWVIEKLPGAIRKRYVPQSPSKRRDLVQADVFGIAADLIEYVRLSMSRTDGLTHVRRSLPLFLNDKEDHDRQLLAEIRDLRESNQLLLEENRKLRQALSRSDQA